MLEEVMQNIERQIDEMFKKTIDAHKEAITALIQADNKKAMNVLENDELINQMEERINYDIMLAIAKYQPVAIDLRKLLSSIRVATDLERIADYAKTISKTALVNSDKTFLSATFLKNSLKMSKIITDLLKKSQQTFLNDDVDGAYLIVARETQFNRLLSETIKSNPFELIEKNNADSYVMLMGVLRTLERSRDHIANICEATIFVGNGKFVEL